VQRATDDTSDTPTFETRGQSAWRWLQGGSPPEYWLMRWVFLRALGAMYAIAFVVCARQALPLIGSRGLLPAELFLDDVAWRLGSRAEGFARLPSLFWVAIDDTLLLGAALLGLLLSLALLFGRANVLTMLALYALYLSFCNVGQTFWGYGWEMMLLEVGFLAAFLCPLVSLRTTRAASPPLVPVIWTIRWMLFRLMLGAGLIKIRGDECWRDLTCLDYHFETQPIPNPLSPWFHELPTWMLRGGVVFNHVIELLVPFLLLGPRRLRHPAALLTAVFQLVLILSGNLAYVNYLTLVLCVACLDDSFWRRVLPRRLQARAAAVAEAAAPPTRTQRATGWVVAGAVVLLSWSPVLNLLSSEQAMNLSYNPMRLVNTYGMFGSIGRVRPEIAIEGTLAERPDDDAEWREYVFTCKPGPVDRAPCVVSPYHRRLDWQVWFAAFQDIDSNPWLIHLVYKLLEGDPTPFALLGENPFPDEPPRWIRIRRFVYSFAGDDDPDGAWWHREFHDLYMPPLERGDPRLPLYLRERGLVPAAPRPSPGP
jgi:hypothetical protein